ncbi:MAG TPA: hypothetical protein VGH19_23695 [Verrucomicrobiae bacterium]
MSNKFEDQFTIRSIHIITFLLLIGSIISFILLKTNPSPMVTNVAAGFFTSFVMMFIQTLIEWRTYSKLEALTKLKIKHVLHSRDNKAHYERLLTKTAKEVLVLGTTASRFIEDFAHATRSDSQSLLPVLAKNVPIKILLPKSHFLEADDRSRAEIARRRMSELKSQYPNFQVRYFEHPATHSLVKLDDECLVGPIFPKVKSKDSPTIHTSADSPFVQEYLNYFHQEWQNASEAP